MLESLLIRNIALFEQASIQFDAGLHVLTGETGAGKSLVVDAVNFLCGARAEKTLIRSGSDSAFVEGIFLVDGLPDLLAFLETQGISPEEGRLYLSREMNLKGRSLCRVNGMAFSLAAYQELTSRLVDLHGQHEHQSLLQENKHIKYLDLLGDTAHAALLGETRDAFTAYDQARKAYEDALKQSKTASERVEILHIRVKELRDAKLVPDEEEGLAAEKNMLRNAGKISDALNQASAALAEDARDASALSQVRQALSGLEKIAAYHPAYQALNEKIQSLYYELEEAAHEISLSLRDLHHDDARLEQVETRLDFLRKLQRKYGADNATMLKALADMEAELQSFDSLDQDLDRLAIQKDALEKQLRDVSKALSASRKRLAGKVEKQIEALLDDLNMRGTRFFIHVDSDDKNLGAEGFDQVNMLIAPNAGEEPKPLSKIASGGELSRVMLAMKTLSAEKNVIPTMVFDEIDTGVSGKTAAVIAGKLWDIGRYRQVVCVTHLHQLAAMASTHYHVSKQEEGGRTKASITILKADERVLEIAKMLGDIDTQGASSLQHASVLLDDAKKHRAAFPPVSMEHSGSSR